MGKTEEKNDRHLIRISVRNLVEFVMQSGDIDNRRLAAADKDAMQAGSRIHRKIQKSMGTGYQAEVSLKHEVDEGEFSIAIEGRADGIFQDENGVVIDEIKGMYMDLDRLEEPLKVHEAQAMCYGYIYCVDHDLDVIGIQVTYCSLETEDIRRFARQYSVEELTEWFQGLIHEYVKWARYLYEHGLKRDESLRELEFPYPYRPGQKDLAVSVYRSIAREKNLFIQAPTGVGKTLSVVYPGLKAMGEQLIDKVFYLTARTITRSVAEETFSILRERGMYLKAVTITAKEKMCFLVSQEADRGLRSGETGLSDGDALSDLEVLPDADSLPDLEVLPDADSLPESEALPDSDILSHADTRSDADSLPYHSKPSCNPDDCPYAKGHFDRVNDAVYDLIHKEFIITREVILKYARKYQVCPFEFCLDISNWVDAIICDYNYVFDPNVRLRRYFSEGISGDYLFLVDEAHNLVSRAREMYSAEIYKEDVLLTKRLLQGKSAKLTRLLERVNRQLLEMKRESDGYVVRDNVNALAALLQSLYGEFETFMDDNRQFDNREQVLDFYFKLRNFMMVFQELDDHYTIYSELLDDGRFMVRLFCMNPAGNLKGCLEKGRSTIFFSATLLPVNYYKELLSGNLEDYAVYAQSPFPKENRLLLVAEDVSSRYTRRNQREYEKVADYIYGAVSGRQGNYMVFFPSYSYMNEVQSVWNRRYDMKTHGGDTGNYDITLPIMENERDAPSGITVICQDSRMSEAEKEDFLNAFEQERQDTLVAFCVMGGMFSEGIDLKEERLIGAIVVGAGLPMVCTEQKLLESYFDSQGRKGFDYAYQYPGMNKVQQSAGRVIRTMEDRGIILLLDDRFLRNEYQALFPREWWPFEVVNRKNAAGAIERFWQNQKF